MIIFQSMTVIELQYLLFRAPYETFVREENETSQAISYFSIQSYFFSHLFERLWEAVMML